MQDRIKIGDVWYVKEKNVQKREVTPCYFLGAVIEDDEYCFEASVLLSKDKIREGTLSVKYIDKRTKEKEEDYWDNVRFLEGVLKRNREQINVLVNSIKLSAETIEDLISFLEDLEKKNWFK